MFLEHTPFKFGIRNQSSGKNCVQNQLCCEMLQEKMFLVKGNKCYYICMFSKSCVIKSRFNWLQRAEASLQPHYLTIPWKFPSFHLQGPSTGGRAFLQGELRNIRAYQCSQLSCNSLRRKQSFRSWETWVLPTISNLILSSSLDKTWCFCLPMK